MGAELIVAVVSVAVTLLGTVFGLLPYLKSRSDDKRKSKEDADYRTWSTAVREALSSGGSACVNYTADQAGWADRAVVEGALERGPFPNTVMLPTFKALLAM